MYGVYGDELPAASYRKLLPEELASEQMPMFQCYLHISPVNAAFLKHSQTPHEMLNV